MAKRLSLSAAVELKPIAPSDGHDYFSAEQQSGYGELSVAIEAVNMKSVINCSQPAIFCRL